MAKNKPTTPKHGYGFTEKQKYRESVWDVFADRLDPEKAVVVFLPSKEGHEIPLALERGFKEENLIAIDDCPAVIAASKWRKQYPRVKFYGNSISRAAQRIKKDGISVDAANLDLCGNISMPMMDEFKGFMLSGCLSGEAVVSLTMLCGRESTATNTLAELYLKSIDREYKHGFNKRIQVLISTLDTQRPNKNDRFFIKYECEGEYKSGTQKMTFGIFSIIFKQEIQKRAAATMHALESDIQNHQKIKNEHYDLRSYCSGSGWKYGGEKYLRGSERRVKITTKNKTLAQDANDIYITWLRWDKGRIEKCLDQFLYDSLEGFSYGCASCAHRFILMQDKTHDWHAFYDRDFYAGVKGHQSMGWCANHKRAEKYLDSIDWKIIR